MNYERISDKISEPFSENLQKLAALFPSVIKDGQLDLDELRAQLGDFEEVGKEKYGLTWAGKQDAQKKAGEPAPDRDNTQKTIQLTDRYLTQKPCAR